MIENRTEKGMAKWEANPKSLQKNGRPGVGGGGGRKLDFYKTREPGCMWAKTLLSMTLIIKQTSLKGIDYLIFLLFQYAKKFLEDTKHFSFYFIGEKLEAIRLGTEVDNVIIKKAFGKKILQKCQNVNVKLKQSHLLHFFITIVFCCWENWM